MQFIHVTPWNFFWEMHVKYCQQVAVKKSGFWIYDKYDVLLFLVGV